MHQYDAGVALYRSLSMCGVYSLIYGVVPLIPFQREYKGPLPFFAHVDLSHCRNSGASVILSVLFNTSVCLWACTGVSLLGLLNHVLKWQYLSCAVICNNCRRSDFHPMKNCRVCNLWSKFTKLKEGKKKGALRKLLQCKCNYLCCNFRRNLFPTHFPILLDTYILCSSCHVIGSRRMTLLAKI